MPQEGQSEQIEDGLKVWGYMPGHVHWKVGAVDEVSFFVALSSSTY